MPILVGLDVIMQPVQEPVEVSTLCKWLHVDEDTEDEIITLLLQGCRQDLEAKLRRAFLTQTLTATFELDEYKGGNMSGPYQYSSTDFYLPRPPLQALQTVAIETDNDVFTAVESGTFYKYTQENSHVEPLPEAFYDVFYPWWNVQLQEPRLKFTYTAGYASPDKVPAQYKLLLLKYCAAQFFNREDATVEMKEIEQRITELKVHLIN